MDGNSSSSSFLHLTPNSALATAMDDIKATSTISNSNVPVWEYSDPEGDLIIVLETEQYRVWRDLIEAHSKPLTLALSACAPDKCAVLRLSSSSEDWHAVMRLIMDSPIMLSAKVLPIQTVLAILRLHHQFSMPILKGYADDDLKRIFPYKFNEWQNHQHEVSDPDTNIPEEHTSGHEFESIMAILDPKLLEDGHKYLPVALYQCICQRTMIEIMEGRDEPDGPSIFLEVKKMLDKGAKALSRDCSRRRYKWWVSRNDTVHPRCKTPKICRQAVQKSVDNILEATDAQRVHDALYSFSELLGQKWYLCTECRSEADRATVEAARSVFNQLPTYFSLPPWEQLLGTASA